jgi:hypothetical protein
MTDSISLETQDFSKRLRGHSNDEMVAFAEIEIMSGRPFIFRQDEDMSRFQQHIANALQVEDGSSDILIVGSAKTGFSLDPDNYFVPFRETSDIDVAVINESLFDWTWHTMLAWDYLTIKNRNYQEGQWLRQRQNEVWSGWYDPRFWNLRQQGGTQLSFPNMLKPMREFSFRWFSAFRSLSRYKYHPEVPRHKANARLYRTRTHAALYHATGLRMLRNKLLSLE